MTSDSASLYEISFFSPSPRLAVCFVVFITRKLLDTQSDTQDAERPNAADLTRNKSRSSSLAITGSFSFKKLYVRNQGKLERNRNVVGEDLFD